MADNGSINHCVRWNTALTPPLPTATKTEGSAALFTAGSILDTLTLVAFEGFSFTEASVKVVGYTVKLDGVAECDVGCYRGAHLDDPQGLSSCPGGEGSRYDISFLARIVVVARLVKRNWSLVVG
jgi:hypothetical protein